MEVIEAIIIVVVGGVIVFLATVVLYNWWKAPKLKVKFVSGYQRAEERMLRDPDIREYSQTVSILNEGKSTAKNIIIQVDKISGFIPEKYYENLVEEHGQLEEKDFHLPNISLEQSIRIPVGDLSANGSMDVQLLNFRKNFDESLGIADSVLLFDSSTYFVCRLYIPNEDKFLKGQAKYNGNLTVSGYLSSDNCPAKPFSFEDTDFGSYKTKKSSISN